MPLLASLLLAAAAPSAPGYPAAAILAAFDSACGAPGDPAANAALLERTGWTRLNENARTPLSRAVYKMLHGSYSLDSSTDFGAQFRKTVAGRTLYVLLSQTSYGGSASGTDFECTLHDFKAPRAFTADELGAWSAGKTLERTDTEPNGELGFRYEADNDVFLHFYIHFVPKGEGKFYSGLSLWAAAHRWDR